MSESQDLAIGSRATPLEAILHYTQKEPGQRFMVMCSPTLYKRILEAAEKAGVLRENLTIERVAFYLNMGDEKQFSIHRLPTN